MKRFFAIFLIFSILFLCACKGKEIDDTTTSNASTTEFVPIVLTTRAPSTVPATEPVIISDWQSDLIPENFPSPPEGTHSFEASKEKKGSRNSDYDYQNDFIRIEFVCPEQNFSDFTNRMSDCGYFGGSKRIAEGTYYSNGYRGYWRDDKNIIKIDSTYTDINGNMTVIIDIIPAVKDNPEAVAEKIPVFDGYSTGYYYIGYDASGAVVTEKFSNKLHTYWRYEYRFSNCFAGVSYDEFESYYKTLGDLGYSGVIVPTTLDGCDILAYDMIKVEGNETYGVFVIFNQTTRTLDVAYTNHPQYYTNYQQ